MYECQERVWRSGWVRESCGKFWNVQKSNTIQGTNISHLGKRNIIFKMPFLGDMLVPWRVNYKSLWVFSTIYSIHFFFVNINYTYIWYVSLNLCLIWLILYISYHSRVVAKVEDSEMVYHKLLFFLMGSESQNCSWFRYSWWVPSKQNKTYPIKRVKRKIIDSNMPKPRDPRILLANGEGWNSYWRFRFQFLPIISFWKKHMLPDLFGWWSDSEFHIRSFPELFRMLYCICIMLYGYE